MLKILLVDDEVAICRGMKSLILKADAAGVLVQEAYDGVEALDAMDEFDPDVLLTDMRMPRMDGLELIREAKRRKPELLTAIVSAYSDYEYVREAMLMNATDYLLKPAAPDAVHELLGRLRSRAEQQSARKEREAVESMLQGVHADVCPPSLRASRFALLLFCAGPYAGGATDAYPGDGQRLASLLDESAGLCAKLGMRSWAVRGERPNERFVALAADGSDADARMRRFLDGLKEAIHGRKKPVTVMAATGLTPEQLYGAGRRLRRELIHALVFGKSTIVHVGDGASRKTDLAGKFAKETARVMDVAMQGKYDLFAEELSALMTSWENGDATQFVIQQTLFRLLAELGDRGLEKQIDLEMLVSHSLGYAELRHHVSLLFHDLFDSPEPAGKTEQVGTIVGQVEQYLKKNFRQSITLQSLSQEFGLVPNYLSVLFKRETGMTPAEYLTAYRIGAAKRLMDERPDMLLKQVASEVGYSDQLYFSRVFRKQTGKSPSEYVQSRQR
ncbi:response regulator transcription factor [Paenibacillus sp. GYB003]|uniref:response regulator transcription factor n=1 Tax=Paenibacillus sp. GYB003 TaxID=2994392 RepID=UPI002F962A5C